MDSIAKINLMDYKPLTEKQMNKVEKMAENKLYEEDIPFNILIPAITGVVSNGLNSSTTLSEILSLVYQAFAEVAVDISIKELKLKYPEHMTVNITR